jgi:hypothetical protein
LNKKKKILGSATNERQTADSGGKKQINLHLSSSEAHFACFSLKRNITLCAHREHHQRALAALEEVFLIDVMRGRPECGCGKDLLLGAYVLLNDDQRA